MPLIRVSLRAGKPDDYRRAIAENIYESLRETFNVPENDFFATVDELEPRDFIYDRKYFNVERTDDLVLRQHGCRQSQSQAGPERAAFLIFGLALALWCRRAANRGVRKSCLAKTDKYFYRRAACTSSATA